MQVTLEKRHFLLGKFEQVVSVLSRRITRLQSSQIILPCSLHDLALANEQAAYDVVDICTTDSMWLSYFFRFSLREKIERVYGPDLIVGVLNKLALSEHDKQIKQLHYFVCADQLTARKMKAIITERYPNLLANYSILPKSATKQQEDKHIQMLVQARPAFVWLGIGSPKQVQLAALLKKHSKGIKIFCVGAAFAFLTKQVRQAPVLLQQSGLEWLWRLLVEPRRLWRRYLITIPHYLYRLVLRQWSDLVQNVSSSDSTKPPPKNLRIIFSTYEAKEIGGSYLRSLSLAQGLVKLGHQVTLWTSAKNLSFIPKFSKENGVLVIESIGLLPARFRKGGYDPFDVLFRSFVILFSKCDVTHSFNHRPAATFPALIKKIVFGRTQWFVDWADLWGKGGIADRRYGPFSFLTKTVDHYTEQLFIKLPDAVTPISDDLVRKALLMRQSKTKVFFLGVGANIEGIKPMELLVARKKLQFPKANTILAYLYVGTYDEELLAKTFVKLCTLRDDVTLMLLGPQLPSFEKIISKFPSVSKQIWRLGVVPREELAWYLASADAMLLPFANKEINLGKFPNKLGDYLAAGRPILANPTGEVKKILENYSVGALFPEKPELFAAGIAKALSNPKQLKVWGQNARKLAERLSWRTVAKQLDGFYRQ